MMLFPSVFDDGLFDDFMDFPTVRQSRDDWNHFLTGNMNSYMKTDIKEAGDHYELDIDMPGYDKDDVSAEIKDGYLTISAETKFDNSDEHEGKYIRRERYYGTSTRSFYVGEELTEEDIKAKFEDGILKISVPKKQSEEKIETPKFIQIEG